MTYTVVIIAITCIILFDHHCVFISADESKLWGFAVREARVVPQTVAENKIVSHKNRKKKKGKKAFPAVAVTFIYTRAGIVTLRRSSYCSFAISTIDPDLCPLVLFMIIMLSLCGRVNKSRSNVVRLRIRRARSQRGTSAGDRDRIDPLGRAQWVRMFFFSFIFRPESRF